MSVLELKQKISRLSPRQRREIQIYLLSLKRDTPAWKRATAKRIRDMQAGKQVSIEELEARMRRS
jgi:response regulator RpfG family c-di-GMP phosphodiesterase